jgi:hypothetical protein
MMALAEESRMYYHYVTDHFGLNPEETWHAIVALNGLAPEVRYFAGSSALAGEIRSAASNPDNARYNGPAWKAHVAHSAADKIAKLENWKANAIWFFVTGFWAGTRANEG